MSHNERIRTAALGCVLASAAGPAAPPWILEMLSEGLAGVSLFATNVTNAPGDAPAPFTDQVRQVKPDAILAIDEEGGDVTRLSVTHGAHLPSHAVLGHLDQLDLTEQTAHRIGRNLHSHGINLNYAPCADVNSVDTNPVIGTRSFGQDPNHVAKHVNAYIKGLHSAGVAACTKHFPGHGSTSLDSHLALPLIPDSIDVVSQRDLPPFLAAIEAGTDAIMLGHLQLPHFGELPTSQNPKLISWLRHELGFNGTIITDALDMEAVSDGKNLASAAVASLAAGNDLLCLGSNLEHHQVATVIEAIVDAVYGDALSLDQLEASVTRNQLQLRQPAAGNAYRSSDSEFGATTAAAALQASGSLAAIVSPVVIECRPQASIAATKTTWGVAHLIEDHDWPTHVHTTDPDSDHQTISGLTNDQAVVIIVRDLVAKPWQRTVLEQAKNASNLVVVELGWPAPPDQPHDAYIATRSASLASGQAVADLLEANHRSHTETRN